MCSRHCAFCSRAKVTRPKESPRCRLFHALEKKEYALLLMDLNYRRDTTSGQEGLSAISKIQEIDSTLPIVVMTAWATIELAVDAMKRGARDFVTKPWDNQRLLTIVKTQIELAPRFVGSGNSKRKMKCCAAPCRI
jgi:Response regulator containing CheY-like receiver, AAA-type ATPase, and DNA-binding domains